MYLTFDLANVIIGECEVNMYALTPKVSFQWIKISVCECAVNIKSA